MRLWTAASASNGSDRPRSVRKPGPIAGNACHDETRTTCTRQHPPHHATSLGTPWRFKSSHPHSQIKPFWCAISAQTTLKMSVWPRARRSTDHATRQMADHRQDGLGSSKFGGRSRRRAGGWTVDFRAAAEAHQTAKNPSPLPGGGRDRRLGRRSRDDALNAVLARHRFPFHRWRIESMERGTS
jgi:hypothetical protein